MSPGRFVAVSTRARREGRVYVDHLRNARGATAVASFSTRARPGAPVATPIAWEEVTADLDPAAFDVVSVPRRLASMRRDPWEGIETAAASLSKG
jgi:bifunctional non-homologous end joining protein LigD